MNHISANIDLLDYVNKFVIVDLEGVHKKFTVQPVDNTLVYPSSAILLNNEYSILGLADVQYCPPCSATFVIWDTVPERFLSMGDRTRLAITTRGSTEDLTYQWYKNGTSIYGATADNYVIPPVVNTDNGTTYKIGITGLCNIAYSENKIWLGTNQYFATACGIAPDHLFNYSLKDNLYRYNDGYGDLVNGKWLNYERVYTFVDGAVTRTSLSCISAVGHTPPYNQWTDPSLPVTTPPPTTTTPCPCTDYLFYSECFPPPEDEGFFLSYCCGKFYEGSSPYDGFGYRFGYRYQFVGGVIQGDGRMCTTTTPPPCRGTTFFNNCGETGNTITLYQCGPYWYFEPTANVGNLVSGTYSKDGNKYIFATGVVVSLSVCPDCYTETYYLDCTEGASTVTYYVKEGVYFFESGDCAVYDPTDPGSTPTGVVDGVTVYGSNYPGRTKYEIVGGSIDVIGNCPLPTTTTVPPECCSTYGYEPSPLEEWGSNYNDIVVSCAGGFGTKTCYYYVPPTTTTTSTTTPAPCTTGSVLVGSTSTYTFSYDGYGNINLTYSPYSNPLFPQTLNATGGTPFSVYSSDCVAGSTNLFIVAGCYSEGSSCSTTSTTPPPTTTTTTTITPCTPAGTLLSTYCNGYDLHGTYADGSCGTYDELITAYSPDCGYVPPTTTTTTTTTTIPPCTPAGTLLGTMCVGFDLHGTYADGLCNTYDELINANDISCGYTPPVTTTTLGP